MPSAPTVSAPKPGVMFPVLQLPKIELQFFDGTSLWLRQVNNDWLKRSIEHEGEVLEVDLRRIVPDLDAQLHDASEHDRAGLIFFPLRHMFKTASEFVLVVVALQQPTRSH